MPAKGQFKYDWLRVLDDIDARQETHRAAALRLGVSPVSISLNRKRLNRPYPAAPKIDWAIELCIAEQNQETLAECASRLACSSSVVYAAAKRFGFQFYRPNRASEVQNRELVIEWTKAGYSPKAIAGKLGISRQRISQIVLKYEAKSGVELTRGRKLQQLQQPNNAVYQWRIRMGLTRLKAAVALGVGHERMACWDRGQPPPLSVRLAMAAIEHGISPIGEEIPISA